MCLAYYVFAASVCEVHSRDDASARKIATLREVFEEFQSTPINIDIKINNDDLIQKVCDEQRHGIELGRLYVV